jgi:16S rRNA C967 or C1407 C5-methylase (RsmB/RsmF family)/NOL1/NOP2/fmu family ribosome biogenesis protein
MMQLPPLFVRQMRTLLGEEYPSFAAALAEVPPVSVRLNPFKHIEGKQGPFAGAAVVPWCAEGRYLPERPDFSLDPLFHAGAYYVQEASSMFLSEVVRRSVDLSKPLRALDLCAAPGGKATLLQAALPPDSLVVANEVVRSRLGALRENLEKWGALHFALTSASGEDWEGVGAWFDLVVVDAPCSGEGLFRKNNEAVREWSPAHVEACALRQRAILTSAIKVLRPGGVLVYSTCTFNRVENEENAEWLAQTFDLEPIVLHLPDEWGIVASGEGGYRFFPHHLRGEGFFLSAFRLKEGTRVVPPPRPPSNFRRLQPLGRQQLEVLRPWIRLSEGWTFFSTPQGDALALPTALLPELRLLDHALTHKWLGVRLGQFKGRDFVPEHSLALSLALSPEVPAVDFSREEALLYLKKEHFWLPATQRQRGWVIGRFEGLPIGWLKVLPDRWNNYLPAERRLRRSLS